MVIIDRDSHFEKTFEKIRDPVLREKVKKQIRKIIQNPEIGKPMRYGRKGTREAYIKPFRLSYAFLPEEDKIILLELYHKYEQ